MINLTKLKEIFGNVKDFRFFRAPGRVNIIGEHTDYNDGFVLPFAVDRFVFCAVRKNNTDKIRIFSALFNELDEFTLDEINDKSEKFWVNYPKGILWVLKNHGYEFKGMDIFLDSNLPVGAGLSSSAAIEMSVLKAVSTINNIDIDKKTMAKMGQKAENEFVGVRCGIMDQFTSAFGKKNHAIFLDTMTLEYKYVPLQLKDYRFLIIDTNVKHSLASGEYNLRRRQCEEVLKLTNKKSFRELKIEEINTLPEILKKRAMHVLAENERVLKTVEALESGEIEKLGELLYQSHYSLKDLYEVSCEELDFVVDFLKEKDIAGARMVGGGFGGSVIALVKKDVEDLKKELSENFKARFSIDLSFEDVQAEDGAMEIEV
ncbi:MAG: galactokinase [Thermotogaceae bacterium]|jgi:galactokinase|nr:galactokinase [Thermotogaceae bacterium]MDN5337274.1 galactokinase [Thermotogaceae bacterium]